MAGTTDRDQAVQRVLDKHGGDPMKAVAELMAENAYVQGLLAKRKAEPPPGEDADGLSAEDAAAWNEFRGLGLKPAEIKAALSELGTLRGSVAKHERDRALGRHGFNPETLSPLLPADASVIEVEDAEVQGRHLAIKAGDGNPVPLNDWIAANLAHFPAGTFDASRPGGRSGGGPVAPPPSPERYRDGPPPERRRGDRDDVEGIAKDLRVQVGYAGF